MSDTANGLDRFDHVPLLIEFELGLVPLALETILKMSEGDVLRIGEAIGVPVRVLAGGIELGFADLVAQENRVAARIVRITQHVAAGGKSGNS